MKLLLDEMYPAKLAVALRDEDIDAIPIAELGLAGRPDADVFAAARDAGRAVLTENVGDFARLSGEHLAAGGHHSGVLIALSSRFSRRPSGYGAIVAAVKAVAAGTLVDRLVFLEHPKQS